MVLYESCNLTTVFTLSNETLFLTIIIQNSLGIEMIAWDLAKTLLGDSTCIAGGDSSVQQQYWNQSDRNNHQ